MQCWLNDIHDDIAQDKPHVANRVVHEIIENVQILHDFPKTGYQYGYQSRSKPGEEIRILLYGHYRIAYLLINNNQIDIFKLNRIE